MNAILRTVILAIPLSALVYSQAPEPHSLAALLGNSGFVRIPAGRFTMGSQAGNPDEQPVRHVRIPKGLEMSRYEVTQAQWDAVMRNPHAGAFTTTRETPDMNPSHFKGESLPVENVSWETVQSFINALNLRDPKHTYRLPTEAEWEYAARAGVKADVPTDLDAIAWFKGNSGGETHPVGQRKPNAWGLYDMYGNVFEWVQDWYAPDSYTGSPAADAQSGPARSYKVYRGCGWLSEPKYCRPSFRMFDFPSQGQYSIGFRLVRTRK